MRSVSKEIRVVMEDLKKDPLQKIKFIIFLRSYILTIAPFVVTLSFFSTFSHSYVYYALLFLVAGFTQNALGVFMHEGSHYFFMDNKKWNDAFANVLFCFVLMNTVDGYRKEHMRHHKYSGEPLDPYLGIYDVKSKKDLFKKLFFDLTLLTMVEKFIQRYLKPAADTEPTDVNSTDKKTDYLGLVGIALANALFFLLFYYITKSIFGYFIFWVLPLLIIPAVVNRIRTFVEHYSPAGQEEANRSVVPSFLEYLLIAPYGYSYHFIHHTTASIPYYFMRKSHLKLNELGVKFEDNEIGMGYMRTFFKLYKTLPAK